MKKTILSIFILCLVLQGFNTPQAKAELPIPEAGAINTHDLDTLRKFEAEKQIEQDFQKFQDTEENQIKEEKDKSKKKKKKKS
ncbi:MAG: hypothetical protein K6C94_08495 [Candidatus Gastranaerophilales bacterium]|nr:hypothetical protein [Candidatus Gastranaerophilales bacterium]